MHGHRRGESSANLLGSEGSGKPDDYEHTYGDGFYDHPGPSDATLYDDPERSLPYTKEGPHEAARNYQNFGMPPCTGTLCKMPNQLQIGRILGRRSL